MAICWAWLSEEGRVHENGKFCWSKTVRVLCDVIAYILRKVGHLQAIGAHCGRVTVEPC
jgi:hypothetical protein